jgi:hypothetical protein
VLQLSATVGYELSHAMADITQNGLGVSSLNEEAVIETEFSWEHFVWGGRTCLDEKGNFCVAPWPHANIWIKYADDGACLNFLLWGE